MDTLTLGHSGINVSEICLGILQFGTRVDQETSFAILDAYYEAGGRFIDTANNYSKWHADGVGTESETMLGRWLAARGTRNDMVIATKVGFNRDDIGPSLSRATIEKEIEGSLKRIGTDHVDLYYSHADIRTDALDEALRTFDDLVRAGKVRAVGCSNYRAWRIAEARCASQVNGLVEFCCVQQRHTYLRPRPGASFGAQVSANEDLLDYCREHPELRMLAYTALLAGAYVQADKPVPAQYESADNELRLKALRKVAGETGATPPQVIYAWLLQGDPAVIPLTAPSKLEQLRENLGALDLKLTAEQLSELSDAGSS